MLAVVVVPLVVLLGACLLERLEARVTPTASSRPVSWRTSDRAAATARRHLRAVPATTPEGTARAGEESWHRAS